MATLDQILHRPVITEKSTRLRENNKYVIEVSKQASKGQIKTALEDRFKVQVLSIRTIKVIGKYRRVMGPKGGYQSDTKKAIVQLKPGQQITWEEVS